MLSTNLPLILDGDGAGAVPRHTGNQPRKRHDDERYVPPIEPIGSDDKSYYREDHSGEAESSRWTCRNFCGLQSRSPERSGERMSAASSIRTSSRRMSS